MWVLSIFFGLSFLCLLPQTWTATLLILPTLLLNPKLNNLLKTKYNFNNKLWITLCIALISLFIVSSNLPSQVSKTSAPINSTINNTSNDEDISSQTFSSSLNNSTSNLSSTTSNITSLNQTTSTQNLQSKLKVHFLDVGQGDSEFIELPNGQTMLIDAGNLNNGNGIVSYIKNLKHNKIDYLITTHPHADHIGGMTSVVNNLDIGKIYMPKKSTTTKTFENLLLAIKNKGLKINTAKAGMNLLNANNLKIDMIAPVGSSYKNLNDYSAVIKLTYGSNSFLFMGDASNISENQITENVKADVLKVGHHGSATSTSGEFLNKVSPKYAVIEVGKGNSYGHPKADTLKRLSNLNAKVYRTDECGTIIFTSDSKTITVDKKASSIKENAPSVTNKIVTPKSKSKTVITSPSDNKNVTVYVTNSGKKYHSAECKHLNKSKISISLTDAKSQGYTPCSHCHPPQ